MKPRAEHLPVELWISIFSYLEVHDIFHGFTNLNNYFDRLLASHHLSLNVRLKKPEDHRNKKFTPPSWLNGILERIICLDSTGHHGYDYVPEYLRYNTQKFTRLQTLTIRVDVSQTKLMSRLLSQLHSLEYLSIICQLTAPLIESILSVHTLRVCQIDLVETYQIENNRFNITSNIEAFYLICPNSGCFPLTYILTSHMPNLKRLELSKVTYICAIEHELIRPEFILPQLRTIILTAENGIPFTLFFEYLRPMVPALKRLHVETRFDWMYLEGFDSFIFDYWQFLENIEQIYIVIKGYGCGRHHPKLLLYRKILLAKNDDYNNDIRIKWIEKDMPNVTFNFTIVILKNYAEQKFL